MKQQEETRRRYMEDKWRWGIVVLLLLYSWLLPSKQIKLKT
jgi:hypothetical protein